MPEDIRVVPARERWNISRLALRHPRPTLALWLGVALAGTLALGNPQLADEVLEQGIQNALALLSGSITADT